MDRVLLWYRWWALRKRVAVAMTSLLLAALSLPPICDFHLGSDPNARDRPLPLEPSASQDALVRLLIQTSNAFHSPALCRKPAG